MPALSPIEQILDLARWAPSGDNTQPWRFEVVNESRVVVHGFDTRDHCVYDLDGRPSQLSLGGLLETMRIAATCHGWATQFQLRPDSSEIRPTIDVVFAPDANVLRDDLAGAITTRSVQRRPMRTRPLTDSEKNELLASVGESYRVHWIEGVSERWRMASLLFRYAKLRLTMLEAYLVHRDIIEWRSRFSADRVPDQALGIDPATVHLMRFVMQSWARVRFFNTFLAGTWLPRIQMDLIPGLACAAHFVIVAKEEPATLHDYLAGGRAMQRFWLTATRLGLTLQPEMTPLIFSRYVRDGLRFSAQTRKEHDAAKLSVGLQHTLGAVPVRHAVFMGRIGAGPLPQARSTRRSVKDLLLTPSD